MDNRNHSRLTVALLFILSVAVLFPFLGYFKERFFSGTPTISEERLQVSSSARSDENRPARTVAPLRATSSPLTTPSPRPTATSAPSGQMLRPLEELVRALEDNDVCATLTALDRPFQDYAILAAILIADRSLNGVEKDRLRFLFGIRGGDDYGSTPLSDGPGLFFSAMAHGGFFQPAIAREATNLSDSVGEFEKAVQLEPGNGAFAYFRALALSRTGASDEDRVNAYVDASTRPDFVDYFQPNLQAYFSVALQSESMALAVARSWDPDFFVLPYPAYNFVGEDLLALLPKFPERDDFRESAVIYGTRLMDAALSEMENSRVRGYASAKYNVGSSLLRKMRVDTANNARYRLDSNALIALQKRNPSAANGLAAFSKMASQRNQTDATCDTEPVSRAFEQMLWNSSY